ncbi:hypothetical protein BDE36_3085 [Arcticibacter tournemirensis]|uniref:Uncharacterized protein n=1 Tax=Arcticibacter tournemirensis TaxID=699437 RepID=A0A5M9GRZ5_9SPHI|nr:DUF5695 domain-containing protein [Arcticibacter tournemirensis]KAA8477483.1 hypothetical protein F1649_18765 [Arcticibacter tournemirensis]TQM51308.1 hypothetical protein BDE36_3085 [Arcticibacter tournemirensis]
MQRKAFVYSNRNLLWVLILLISGLRSFGQSPWERIKQMPSTLGLESGLIEANTPSFRLKLVRASQTVASLQPAANNEPDFTPGERLEQRSKDGLYHLGDLNLRLRFEGEKDWKSFSTAEKRVPVRSISGGAGILAACDLAPTLGADIPLAVKRYWETQQRRLVLRFELKNNSNKPVEIGSLGIPMIFNNILEGKSLEEAHASNVFFDPYIGLNAGYLQVVRLSGKGKVLLVLPYKNTAFEAYNPLLKDPTPRGIAFEGFHEWMVHSKAFAENEWKGVSQWNTPTSRVLKPGETVDYGVQFALADSVKSIENELNTQGRPVAVGIPGYVVPEDIEAKLFINYRSKIRSVAIEPEGALSLKELPRAGKGWKSFIVRGKMRGRARLTLIYEDGLKQSIHYKVIKPEEQVVADFGRFSTHEQWFEDPGDPFRRSPSVISYDYEKKAQVREDSRAWIAGLSDEGGAGGWLGAIMKELVAPEKNEVDKLESFANNTLWGGIQYNEGENKYGVRKSMFYYEPDKMPPGTYNKDVNYKTWSAWNQKEAESVGRSYNYPHVAAAWWVLYRLARNYKGLVTKQSWNWYLENALQTSLGMVKLAPHYAQYGQMEGTIFLLILADLKAEGFIDKAAELEAAMKKRADLWKSLEYPFGSEMPWDSTGQEEVYMWSDYFGYTQKAEVTLNAVLAYMPTVPHWGYNGSARRYWDFLYGGKLQRVERQLHHYGSGLNAIPVLAAFRKTPDDLYLLRVGQGGLLGAISNITEDGFGPAAFHSYPSTLSIDGLSGDYGSNFFGYAVNSGTYITYHKEFGWLSFGGNLKKERTWVHVIPKTASRSRVFIAPLGVWLTLDAGRFQSVSFEPETGKLKVELEAAGNNTPFAYLRIESGKKKYQPAGALPTERGTYKVMLGESAVTIDCILR